MLPTRVREVLTLLVTGLVLLASAFVWLTQRPDIGFTIIESGGRYVVESVAPGSEAALIGVQPGSAIVAVDGQPIEAAIREALGGNAPDPFFIDWMAMRSVPDPILAALASASNVEVEVSGGTASFDPMHRASVFYSSIVFFLLGLLILVGGSWWMRGGRAGAGLRGMAVPLASACAVPLLAGPLAAWGGPPAGAAAAIAPVFASLLLADAITALLVTRRWRAVALGIAAAGAVVAALVPLQFMVVGTGWDDLLTGSGWTYAPAVAWWALLLVSLGPMLVITATRPLPGTPLAGADNPGPFWLLAAACTPAVAMLTQSAGDKGWGAWYVVPLWIALLVVGRAVGRRVAQNRLQRDLVVTVTEAERARLAAELHDVALQELTLVVRRLDASGDAISASMVRSISDHLRELCGALHLPILDELGAGPALDWLVEQVATATGEDVRLERADPARPPAAVELAVFRVAQEAISNAVKHGGPPIVVRYVTSPSAASLFVDDAGSGLEIGRRSIAPRPGHYGLATMQQRAELIGALLAIRAWPNGGTRVSLEWKAP